MPAPGSETDADGLTGRRGWTPLTPESALGPLHRLADRTGIGWRAALVVVAGLVLLVSGVLVRSGQASTPVPERTSLTATPSGSGPTGAESLNAVVPGGSGSSPATVVVVHVVGAVAVPGLVRLPSGSRVADAVSAAGGATSEADLSRVNLARPVTDGEQVVVPRPGEQITLAPGGGGTAGSSAAPAGGGPVNLNTADAAALDTLPGIGPVLAERIIAFRTENGPFASVDDLGEVSGIGDRLLEQLRPLVSV